LAVIALLLDFLNQIGAILLGFLQASPAEKTDLVGRIGLRATGSGAHLLHEPIEQ
jgi:hypothetical protein